MHPDFLSRLWNITANSNDMTNEELVNSLPSLRELVDQCISYLNEHKNALKSRDANLDSAIDAWDNMRQILGNTDSRISPLIRICTGAISELCKSTAVVIKKSKETTSATDHTVH